LFDHQVGNRVQFGAIYRRHEERIGINSQYIFYFFRQLFELIEHFVPPTARSFRCQHFEAVNIRVSSRQANIARPIAIAPDRFRVPINNLKNIESTIRGSDKNAELSRGWAPTLVFLSI
jgi:hypothetical protein